MGLKDELLAVQADQLTSIVRGETEALHAKTRDAQHSAEYLRENYSELWMFSKRALDFFENSGLSDRERACIGIGAMLMASTLGKQADIQAMPSFDD